MRLHRASWLACVLVALQVATAQASRPDPAPQRPFAATSVWNAPLPAAAPRAARSAALVANLNRQVRTFGTWLNASEYSVPVYRVPAGQPTRQIWIDAGSSMWTNRTDSRALFGQLGAVPIPDDARPALGSDRNLVIWQPSTDTLWELWLVRSVPSADGPLWAAAWGARIDRVSQSPGIVPAPFGATATGLPLVGGLMTHDEIQRRRIDHALAIALPATAAGRWVWPANRTDGLDTNADAIPAGTRFRIPATVNIAALHLPPLTAAMARAAQRYGVIVNNHAGAVAFYAEDPFQVGAAHDLGGLTPGQVTARFPWSELEVVNPRRAP